jgi:GxxExxY protein
LAFAQQPEFPVHYKGHFVGKGRPDLVVENQIVVDTKVVKAFNEQHDAQMLGYLVLTNLEVGLLLNFKVTPVGKRRILNPYFKK